MNQTLKRSVAALPLAGGALALWWVLRSFNLAAFSAQLRSLDVAWILLAVVLDFATYVAQGFRWRSLLPLSPAVTPFQTTRAIYAGLLLNEVLPLRPGELFRGLLIARRTGVTVAQILPSIIAERLLDGVCLGSAVIVASIWLPALRFARPALAVAGILVALSITLFRHRIPRSWRRNLNNPSALALSTAALLSQGGAVWCTVRACHLPLSLFAAIAVMLVIRLGTLIPGAPANVGAHQASTMLGLSMFGIPWSAASSISFILFGVLTVPLVVAGALAMLTARAVGPSESQPHEQYPRAATGVH